MERTYKELSEVVTDPMYAVVDIRLRRGAHIVQDDIESYSFLEAAAPFLQEFYNSFGAALNKSNEGYYFLTSDGKLLGSTQLKQSTMIVGMVLALLRMDVQSIERQGQVSTSEIIRTLENLIGEQRLLQVLSPRRRKKFSSSDANKIREEVNSAIKELTLLEFVEKDNSGRETCVIPRRSILRFTDPVRDSEDTMASLKTMIENGFIVAELDDNDDSDEIDTND